MNIKTILITVGLLILLILSAYFGGLFSILNVQIPRLEAQGYGKEGILIYEFENYKVESSWVSGGLAFEGDIVCKSTSCDVPVGVRCNLYKQAIDVYGCPVNYYELKAPYSNICPIGLSPFKSSYIRCDDYPYNSCCYGTQTFGGADPTKVTQLTDYKKGLIHHPKSLSFHEHL